MMVVKTKGCKKREQGMEAHRSSAAACFLVCFAVILLLGSRASAYHNYTVGDALGWYDRLQVPQVNYQQWVAGKNFSLGDFLIFNTDKNHSIVQTYNATTYKRCNYNDAESDDTVQWSAGQPKNSGAEVAVAVPLLKEGKTYFFSSNYDGRQCRHGQRFKINVTHGQGLPDSLVKQYLHQAEAPAPAKEAAAEKGASAATPPRPRGIVVPSSSDEPVKDASGVAASKSDGAAESLALVAALAVGLYMCL